MKNERTINEAWDAKEDQIEAETNFETLTQEQAEEWENARDERWSQRQIELNALITFFN